MSRGGARPGAGRKSARYPRKTICLSISQTGADCARQLRAQGVRVNDDVDLFLRASLDAWTKGTKVLLDITK